MNTLLLVGIGIVLGIGALGLFLSFVQAHMVASVLSSNKKSGAKWSAIAFGITAVLAAGSLIMSSTSGSSDGGLVFAFFYILTVPLGIFTIYLRWSEKINTGYLFLAALGVTLVYFLLSFSYSNDLVNYLGYTGLIATFATGALGLIVLLSRATTGHVNYWIIFWLVLFFPVGLYLLWRSEAKTNTKIIVTVIVLVLCFGLGALRSTVQRNFTDAPPNQSPESEQEAVSDFPMIAEDTLAQAMANCQIEAVYIPTRGNTQQAGVCVQGKAYITPKVLMLKTYTEELAKATDSQCQPPRLNTGSTMEEYKEFMPRDCGFSEKTKQ